jgi:hypothetical protein
MDIPEEFADAINEDGDGNFVTNYIIIFETSDGTSRYMNVSISPDMTSWLAEGMLNFGQRVLWQMGGLVSNEEDF